MALSSGWRRVGSSKLEDPSGRSQAVLFSAFPRIFDWRTAEVQGPRVNFRHMILTIYIYIYIHVTFGMWSHNIDVGTYWSHDFEA